MAKKLSHLLTDSRRGLSSFLMYMEELETALVRDNAIGVLFIDGSHLTPIEEKFGCGVFNEVLNKISEVVANMRGVCIRRNDIVALDQVQGHSHMIFLSEPRKDRKSHVLFKDDVEQACDRVQSYLHSSLFFELYTYLKGVPKINVGYSLVVNNPMIHPWRTIYRVIAEASDICELQMSKLELRNRGKLQKIILEQEVTSHYQPIIDVKTATLFGYEALSRGPKNSEIEAPVILFTLAEEAGLVFELDRLCRRQAIINARGKPKGEKLFINTLPNLIFDPEFGARSFIRFLNNNGLNIEDIVFEITERHAIEQLSQFKRAIGHYRDAGIQIAIDDVGAGYSSLEAIMEIQPSFVKIDAAVTRGAHNNPGKQEMLRALHSLSKSIDAFSVAEGVETEEDYLFLKELGIDYAQGYFFARPGPPFPGLTTQFLKFQAPIALDP